MTTRKLTKSEMMTKIDLKLKKTKLHLRARWLKEFVVSFTFALLVIGVTPSVARAQGLDQGIKNKIEKMTLEQKIGQMFMIDIKRKVMSTATANFIAKYKIGNVILFGYNLKTKTQGRSLIQQVRKKIIRSTGTTPLIAVDQEGGEVNRLKTVSKYRPFRYSARTFGDIHQYAPKRASKLFQDVAIRTSYELNDLGVNMNLAPVLDTTENKSSYIYKRSFSGDPETVTNLSRSQIDQLRRKNIMSTGKHFPNLSNTQNDSHSYLPTLNKSKDSLLQYEFVPFKKLAPSLGAIMVGHVMMPQVDKEFPASMSKKIIRLLREDVGFKGIVITDDIKMRALSRKYSIKEIVTRAINAGADVIIIAWSRKRQVRAIEALKNAVLTNQVPMERINDAVLNILRQKNRFFSQIRTTTNSIKIQQSNNRSTGRSTNNWSNKRMTDRTVKHKNQKTKTVRKNKGI